MDFAPLVVQALLIGFVIAVPLGPIGLLCVERTLVRGAGAGFSTGLGVAAADAVWCALLAFGARWMAEPLLAYSEPLRLLGGLVVALLGLRTLLRSVRSCEPSTPPRLSGGAFATAFGLTLANPMTLVIFVAVFAGLGLAEAAVSAMAAAEVVIGIFLGSLLWWACLTLGVARVRHHLAPRTLAWTNRAAGVGLIAFGLALMIFD